MNGKDLDLPPSTSRRSRRFPILSILLLVIVGGTAAYFGIFGGSLQQLSEIIEKKAPDLLKELPSLSITADNATLATPESKPLPAERSETSPSSGISSESAAEPSAQEPQDREENVVLFTNDAEPTSSAPEALESDAAVQGNATDEQVQPIQEAVQTAEAQDNATRLPEPAAQEEVMELSSGTESAPGQQDTPAGEEGQGADTATANATDAAPGQNAAALADLEQNATQQPAATVSSLEDGVWVYWIKSENKDQEVVEKLKKDGYKNSFAKGQWPGHFNDQNIFYRYEDKRGLAQLLTVLNSSNYYDYYFNNERISQNIKRIFTENDGVMFVIILQ